MSVFRRIFKAIDPRPDKHLKDKTIAVGLALLVWVAVNVEEAVPEIFDPVPVVLENLPSDLAIAGDYTQTISVRARGSQRDLGNLTQGRLSPRIDLSAASGGEECFPDSPGELECTFRCSDRTYRPGRDHHCFGGFA